MDQRALHQELIELIKKQSYREGDFTLASGKKSSYYIDMKATTLHPTGAHLVGELAVGKLKDALKSAAQQVGGVGGLTLGADPIATAVSLAGRRHGFFWPAFIVRKEAKDHGTSRFIEGTENLLPGANVVVLEDVVTTGGSSLKAIERLRAAGYVPAAVLTIVDREQGGAETFAQAGVKFLSLVSINELKSR